MTDHPVDLTPYSPEDHAALEAAQALVDSFVGTETAPELCERWQHLGKLLGSLPQDHGAPAELTHRACLLAFLHGLGVGIAALAPVNVPDDLSGL